MCHMGLIPYLKSYQTVQTNNLISQQRFIVDVQKLTWGYNKKRCLTKIDLSDENNNLRKQNPFKIC